MIKREVKSVMSGPDVPGAAEMEAAQVPESK